MSLLFEEVNFQWSFIHVPEVYLSLPVLLTVVHIPCYLICKHDLFAFIGSHESPLFDFIESCLRNKHEMVIYEAASAIIHLPNCTARELAPAVSG